MHRFTSMDENASVACAGHVSVCSQVHSLLRERRGVERAGYVCSVPPTCFCGRSIEPQGKLHHKLLLPQGGCSYRFSAPKGQQVHGHLEFSELLHRAVCFPGRPPVTHTLPCMHTYSIILWWLLQLQPLDTFIGLPLQGTLLSY